MTSLTRGITMRRSRWSCRSRWILVAVAALSLVTGTMGEATTSISQGAVVEVDQSAVNQIMDAFHKADAVPAEENLEGIMALHATQYNKRWYQEVHYLILEGGAWRISGNAGETPRVLPFSTTSHPLF